MIKFSVTIPAYKAKFLKEAINSVISQSYSHWELIILDDCSPENILEICSLYLTDSRIKYYRNTTNVGAVDVVDNWNKCLSYASGDFLICMGDDDVLCENALEVYADYILKFPQYDLFHAFTEIIDEKSEFLNFQESRPLMESVYSMVWHRISRKRDQFIGDFLFRTDKLRAVGGFYKLPLAWASDDITAYLCARDHGVVNIPEILFRYRMNRYTISNTGNVLIKLRAIDCEFKWYQDNIINSRPSLEQDIKYLQLISTILISSFNRKKVSTIAGGMGTNKMSLLANLLRYKTLYNISFRQIVQGFVLNFIRSNNV